MANRCKIVRNRLAFEPRADIRKIRVYFDWHSMVVIDDFRRLARARQGRNDDAGRVNNSVSEGAQIRSSPFLV